MHTERQSVRRRALPMNITVHYVTGLAMLGPAPTREILPRLDQVQGFHVHMEPSIKVPGSCRFPDSALRLHADPAQIKVVMGTIGC